MNFKDLGGGGGAKEITFRELRIFFQGFGEINALFSGIKGAQTHLPGGRRFRCVTSFFQSIWDVFLC